MAIIDEVEIARTRNHLDDLLIDILEDMDVPEARTDDLEWLSRNLGIRNSKHHFFMDALHIISALKEIDQISFYR